MSEWISVKDRLPEDEDYVLVMLKYYTGPVIGWYPADKRRISHDWRVLNFDERDIEWKSEYDTSEVTHWMPLPELPEEEE